MLCCSWLIAIAYWLAGGFIKSGLGNRIAYSMVRPAQHATARSTGHSTADMIRKGSHSSTAHNLTAWPWAGYGTRKGNSAVSTQHRAYVGRICLSCFSEPPALSMQQLQQSFTRMVNVPHPAML